MKVYTLSLTQHARNANGFGLFCTSSRVPRREPSLDEFQAYAETMERLEATRTDYDNLVTLEDDLCAFYLGMVQK